MKTISLDGVWKITLDSNGDCVEAKTPVTDFNAFYKSGKSMIRFTELTKMTYSS